MISAPSWRFRRNYITYHAVTNKAGANWVILESYLILTKPCKSTLANVKLY